MKRVWPVLGNIDSVDVGEDPQIGDIDSLDLDSVVETEHKQEKESRIDPFFIVLPGY